MDTKDKSLLHELQFAFPYTERPFLEIAKRLGLSEEEVIEKVKSYIKKGLIKYIGTVLNLNKLGFSSTLIAANVPEKDLKRAVKIINSFDGISHNYLRESFKEPLEKKQGHKKRLGNAEKKEYNLWFTLSVPANKMPGAIKKIKQLTGIKDLLNLKSERIFKIDARFNLR